MATFICTIDGGGDGGCSRNVDYAFRFEHIIPVDVRIVSYKCVSFGQRLGDLNASRFEVRFCLSANNRKIPLYIELTQCVPPIISVSQIEWVYTMYI